VHLYGQAADMAALERLASRHGLALVEDCCQAHLGTAAGRPVGTIGAAGAFSFYPTKNLGALGDGGAVITNDPSLADRIKRLRNGGQVDRYRHETFGVNSRLDEMQAAVLRSRLPRLAGWTARRRALAALYRSALASGPVDVPKEHDAGHVYHLFVVRARGRDALQAQLAAGGIETLVHYPIPIPRQPAMAGADPHDCPEAARACDELLSLPLHPGLADDEAASVVMALKGHYACVRS
jgi:dTDP-4-amino-4,6-dideoxygalactose transaminase